MSIRVHILTALFAAFLGALVGVKHLALWHMLCFYRQPAEACVGYFDPILYFAAFFISALLVFFAVFYAITFLFWFERHGMHVLRPRN